ncbi:MAG TPA: hypothetical protein VMA54_01000 [Steroidobacteraceae bacterium]|nr:hypothetical protein [Steroidobacteraceae bacterium]
MSFILELNHEYFADGLSAEVLALLAPIDGQRIEVQQFVTRMFRQMRRQRTDAHDFSERLALVTGAMLQHILPGAWGSIPPITQTGRHTAIDEYLARNPWRPLGAGDGLLDLGCGFPPVTTLETADRFPQVSIVGADPSFGEYLVKEASGDYAVFDAHHRLLYFQPAARSAERWRAMFTDPAETRARFAAHLTALRPHLPETLPVSRHVSADGVEIMRNPIAGFERPNVSFRRLGIGDGGLHGFAAARCFNLLYYFDRAFQEESLRWLSHTLIEGGISLTGADWTRSRCARYSVHRREHGAVTAKEFAFSIDNIRPFDLVTFFTLHDDDPGTALMAQLIGVLHGDTRFREDSARRMDEIQQQLGFCARKPDGYLGGVLPSLAAEEAMLASDRIGAALERDGFPERAVDVLMRNGYRAWVNCVGHIAVDPLELP